MEAYLASCKPESADAKKSAFPNLAGFCRFLGCGISEFNDFAGREPALASWVLTVLEDEALNSPASPSLASTYLKQRLGYGEKEKSGGVAAECGELKLIFDHDIREDGA